MVSYAAAITELLGKQRLSQSELAEATGMTEGAITAIMSGRTTRPQAKNRAAIARVLGVSVEELERRARFGPAKNREPNGSSQISLGSERPDITEVELTKITISVDSYDVLSAVVALRRRTHQWLAGQILEEQARELLNDERISRLVDSIRAARQPSQS